jgi:uncharacterized oligopeptide transporter (OPT) family protein
MWPFNNQEKDWEEFQEQQKDKRKNRLKKVVAGLIIGGAITGIIGKKVVDKHSNNEDKEE